MPGQLARFTAAGEPEVDEAAASVVWTECINAICSAGPITGEKL